MSCSIKKKKKTNRTQSTRSEAQAVPGKLCNSVIAQGRTICLLLTNLKYVNSRASVEQLWD